MKIHGAVCGGLFALLCSRASAQTTVESHGDKSPSIAGNDNVVNIVTEEITRDYFKDLSKDDREWITTSVHGIVAKELARNRKAQERSSGERERVFEQKLKDQVATIASGFSSSGAANDQLTMEIRELIASNKEVKDTLAALGPAADFVSSRRPLLDNVTLTTSVLGQAQPTARMDGGAVPPLRGDLQIRISRPLSRFLLVPVVSLAATIDARTRGVEVVGSPFATTPAAFRDQIVVRGDLGGGFRTTIGPIPLGLRAMYALARIREERSADLGPDVEFTHGVGAVADLSTPRLLAWRGAALSVTVALGYTFWFNGARLTSYSYNPVGKTGTTTTTAWEPSLALLVGGSIAFQSTGS